jgi:hypothetical protein
VKLGVALASATLLAATMIACGSDDGATAPSPDAGGTIADAQPPPNDSTLSEASDVDAGASEDAGTLDADASVPPAFVRFAWFVGGRSTSGTPLAFDVCVAPHGTGAFTGPLLATSGFAAGLQPFDVTTYFPVLPGRYDARIVSAGSASCASADAGATDFTSLPAIASGQSVSTVFVDPVETGAMADVFTFTDDTSTTSGKAKVRFVNVSESDLVTPIADDAGDDAGVLVTGADLGIGSGVLFTSLFADVSSQEEIDPTATNGYREIDPLAGVDMTMRPPGSSLEDGQLGTDALTLPAGDLFTAFYATEANAGSPQPVLVWCFDGEPSALAPHLTTCAHVDRTTDALGSMTRFGNFLVDGASADVCVKYHSYGAYVGPLGRIYGGEDGGTPIPSQSLSAYYFLTGGLAFDARFVSGAAADCTTSEFDTTFTPAVEPGGGGFTSLLLTGYDAVPSDAGALPPFDAGPPFDDAGDGGDAGAQPVSSGLTSLAKTVVVIEDEALATPNVAALRLVHLDAAHAQPTGITVTFQPPDGGAPSEWALDDVPYGGFSTRPGPMDPYGYERIVFGAVTVAGDGTDGGAAYTMANDQTTMFAFDDPQAGLRLLACNDFAEDWYFNGPLYADCCVVGAQNCGGGGAEVLPAKHPRSHAHPQMPASPRDARRPTNAHSN